jgi:thiosulfate/3-mercaptopyruvate sulfurtransferase
MKTNALKDEINLIDARRAMFFEGTKETQEHYTRSGHIPGAENICWLDIVDENLFMKDLDTLKAFYKEAGVKKKELVVAYCHVGLRASVIYTVAKGLGYPVKLYDGSYNEYPMKRGKTSY